jgi:tetratricopeptide (TPR) repeat protein
MTRGANQRLASLMALANISNKGLARRVCEVAAEHGKPVSYGHVNVKRWLDGVQPRGMVPYFVAQAIGRRLGRPVSIEEIGMISPEGNHPVPADRYPEHLAESIEVISGLIQADLAGNSPPNRDLDPAAWSDLMVRWLLTPDLATPNSAVAAPSVAIVAVQRATSLFSQLDYQFGGGYARSSLIQYVGSEVAPLLRIESHRKVPELLCASAALLRLAGWTAYDTRRHQAAHRYLTQALRLAQEANDRALGGRILAGMSHQANYLGHYDQAVNLARAAQRGGYGAATPTAMTLFHAMEARGLASLGDRRACERALSEAERWFSRCVPDNEPDWLRYFDAAELAAEFAHCYRDLGDAQRAIEYAGRAVELHDPLYVRSISFCRTVLAAGHVARGEVEQGIALADEVLATASALRSGRCVSYVRDFISRLSPYQSSKLVAEFSARATHVLQAA